MSEFDVVVVGSLNLDLVVRSARHPSPGETLTGSDYAEIAGGKGLNQAVCAARSGARVAMVGAVGDDHAGEYLRGIVQTEGIDDTLLATRPGVPTGRALITVDDSGENSIIIVAGANATVEVDRLPTSNVVLAQLETTTDVVEEAFRRGRAHGATTILNPAPAATLPDSLLDHCDVLVPNEHEVDLLGGRGALVSRVGHLVVTLGAAGAELVGIDGSISVPPSRVEPVDTTGAGDAFCGSLAARLAAGDDVADALRYAAAAGALATTVRGAVPSQPSRRDVLDLLDA
ncbi:ribokinase [Ilumatobacter nonamiensis]|uniref:ribokinase n=1 Tax=Ilumatobacter nonamiensis TaxID=467093 RepID=UPI0003482488|nr:ribokinase [Ilumatobacter nonamiensis]